MRWQHRACGAELRGLPAPAWGRVSGGDSAGPWSPQVLVLDLLGGCCPPGTRAPWFTTRPCHRLGKPPAATDASPAPFLPVGHPGAAARPSTGLSLRRLPCLFTGDERQRGSRLLGASPAAAGAGRGFTGRLRGEQPHPAAGRRWDVSPQAAGAGRWGGAGCREEMPCRINALGAAVPPWSWGKGGDPCAEGGQGDPGGVGGQSQA